MEVFQESLNKLNKNTELFLKHQTDLINKFVEMEAMKQASEDVRKENFWMVSKHALVTQQTRLLQSKIHHFELMKHLNTINKTNENGYDHEKENENNNDDSGKDNFNGDVDGDNIHNRIVSMLAMVFNYMTFFSVVVAIVLGTIIIVAAVF